MRHSSSPHPLADPSILRRALLRCEMRGGSCRDGSVTLADLCAEAGIHESVALPTLAANTEAVETVGSAKSGHTYRLTRPYLLSLLGAYVQATAPGRPANRNSHTR